MSLLFLNCHLKTNTEVLNKTEVIQCILKGVTLLTLGPKKLLKYKQKLQKFFLYIY